jgi:hypothetical protein
MQCTMATVHGYNVAATVAVGILLGSAVICGLVVTGRPHAARHAVTTPASPSSLESAAEGVHAGLSQLRDAPQ